MHFSRRNRKRRRPKGGVIGTKGVLEKVKSMKRERVKVVFGNPIFTKSGDNIDKVTAKTMQEIKKLLPKDY